MSRQTSDRLVPISSAIFVPLATTVAWLMSRRTIRPRRTSVALCTDGRLRVFAEVEMEGIINSRWSMVVSCWQNQFRGRCRSYDGVPPPERLTTDGQRLGLTPESLSYSYPPPFMYASRPPPR